MSDASQPLTIAAIGCGSRSRTFCGIAATMPDRYKIVAGADPVPERVQFMRELSKNDEFKSFSSAEELLAQEKLADIVIIGTQDNYHFYPATEAIKKGYHLLLEKPAAQTLEESLEIARLAKEYDRKVVLGFVLRYTPIYQKVKEIVDSGRLGQVMSLRASEGVGLWHYTHSYVRGHWANAGQSSPMIIAKCSHDLDIIAWILNQRCKRVSSFGSQSFFTADKKPQDALDSSFNGDADSPYSAKKYLREDHRNWLKMIYPDPDGLEDTEKVSAWLEKSPWARDVFACDNDVPDHQVVNMEFENGVTAALTMTAFDYSRSIEIYGTQASLRAGDAVTTHFGKDCIIRDHISGEIEEVEIDVANKFGYQGHGGGDYGIVDQLDKMIAGDGDGGTLEKTIESHIMGFAAEQSRLNGGMPVELDQLRL